MRSRHHQSVGLVSLRGPGPAVPANLASAACAATSAKAEAEARLGRARIWHVCSGTAHSLSIAFCGLGSAVNKGQCTLRIGSDVLPFYAPVEKFGLGAMVAELGPMTEGVRLRPPCILERFVAACCVHARASLCVGLVRDDMHSSCSHFILLNPAQERHPHLLCPLVCLFAPYPQRDHESTTTPFLSVPPQRRVHVLFRLRCGAFHSRVNPRTLLGCAFLGFLENNPAILMAVYKGTVLV